MAISYSIAKHAVCYTSKVLAATGGAHIYNIEIDASALADTGLDNGTVVAKGAWKELDHYGMAASTGVAGVIRGKAANGNWYVEVTNPGTGILIRQVPMIAEEYNSAFKKESNFFNEFGDVVTGYRLSEGDIIELSDEAFDGTPAEDKTLTINNYKWKVAAD